jgi:CBS domain-containing protein
MIEQQERIAVRTQARVRECGAGTDAARVGDWMSAGTPTISPGMPLAHAYNLMVQEQVRRLPVVEGERLVGIITRGDLRGARPSPVPMMGGADPDIAACSLQVRQVMTRRSQAVTEDMSMADAVRQMLDQHLTSLPVVDAWDRPVGMLTETDVFRLYLAREGQGAAP